MAVALFLVPPVFVFVLMILTLAQTNVMSQSDALLKLRRSFTNPKSLDSWMPSSDPCMNEETWVGVLYYRGVITVFV